MFYGNWMRDKIFMRFGLFQISVTMLSVELTSFTTVFSFAFPEDFSISPTKHQQ